MARKQYEQFCLRFSMENPTHVKLFRIINNLDSDIYRSKNQFIMEALEAYVSGKSIDELCKKEKQEEATARRIAELEQAMTVLLTGKEE